MMIVKDVASFIKNPDDFVLQSPKRAALFSIAFKIIGVALLAINSSNLIATFVISSLCFFSASLYIDNKILKNIEPLFFKFIEKAINHKPEKVGFFLGRILNMVMNADPLSRIRGIYQGYFFQSNL